VESPQYARTVADHETEHEFVEARRSKPAIEAPDQAPPASRLASQIGNRGFTSMISRMRDGEGILPNGTVHPDVESTIAARRGRGNPLPDALASRLSDGLGGPVDDVRVHTDSAADALARSVSARAFATGTDIFFANGEYRPGTAAGNQLIAHEVAHTEQQRGAPSVGPLTVSNPGDVLEREADSVARDLLG
jgi:Domain of unknown function (DUF4157)